MQRADRTIHTGPGVWLRLVLVSILIRWAVLAVAFAFTAWILDGVEVSGGAWGYIWVSALFGIVNAVVGTILRIFTFPLIILTLGLFLVIVNALMLQLTSGITDRLSIDQFFWTAIWAAIIISVVSMILEFFVSAILKPADVRA